MTLYLSFLTSGSCRHDVEHSHIQSINKKIEGPT